MHLHFYENATEIVLLIFLLITFLQSGIDKVKDWKGNLSWLNDHFSKSLFKNIVAPLLGIITVIELVVGVLAVIGVVHLALFNHKDFALYAALISCLALLMLFLGQRINKDYDGARTIVVYLVPTVFLLFLLQ